MVTRKKRLELRVSALSDSRSQSTLDAFLRKQVFKRRKREATEGDGALQCLIVGDGAESGGGRAQGQVGGRREGDARVERGRAGEPKESVAGGREGSEKQQEGQPSAAPSDREGAVRLGRTNTTKAAKVGLTLSFEALTDEELRDRKHAELLRSADRTKSPLASSSPFSRSLGFGQLSLTSGSKMARLHSSRFSLLGLKYGLRGYFRPSRADGSLSSNFANARRGLTCLEMDSNGDLFASGTDGGRVSIHKSHHARFAASRRPETHQGPKALLEIPTVSCKWGVYKEAAKPFCPPPSETFDVFRFDSISAV